MLYLQQALLATQIEQGSVVNQQLDQQIQSNHEIQYYKIFEIDTPERSQDNYNQKIYSFILNYNSTTSIDVFLCDTDDYEQCKIQSKSQVSGNINFMQIDNYIQIFNVTNDKLYLLLTSTSQSNVTFQVATAIILSQINKEIVIPVTMNVVLLAPMCNDQTTININDTSVIFCSSSLQSRLECNNTAEQNNNVLKYDNSRYMWINLQSQTTEIPVQVQLQDKQYQLQLEQTQQFQYANYYLCQVQMNLQLDQQSNVTTVYSAYDKNNINSSINFVIYQNNNLIYSNNQYISTLELQQGQYNIYMNKDQQEAILPWCQNFTQITFKFIASSQLQQIKLMQYNNTYDNELVTNITIQNNVNYIASAQNVFGITNFFDEIVQPCIQINNICQLTVENNIVNQSLSYQFIQSDDNKVINFFSGLQYTLEPNKFLVNITSTLGQDGLYHSYFKVSNLQNQQEAKLVIKSNDSNADIQIYCSNEEYFPTENTNDVKMYFGQGNIQVDLDYDMIENNRLTYIQIQSQSQIQFSIEMVYQDVSQIIINNNQKLQMNIKQKIDYNLAYEIPQSILIQNSDESFQESYYDGAWVQVQVLNIDQLSKNFILYIDNMMENKFLLRNYTVMNYKSGIQTFLMPISFISSYNKNYNFMHIVANEECQIELIVCAGHLLQDSYSSDYAPDQNSNVIYYSPVQSGINQYIEVSGNDSVKVTLSICNQPLLLAQYDQQCIQQEQIYLDQTQSYNVDISQIDSSQYIFYTIQSTYQDTFNAIINMSLRCINNVESNTIMSGSLEPGQYFYAQASRNYQEDYLYIQNKLNNIEICISTQFTQTINEYCRLNVTQQELASISIDQFSSNPYILVYNPTTMQQEYQFYIAFVNTTVKGVHNIDIQANVPFVGRFVRFNSQTPVTIAVGQADGKGDQSRIIGLYGAENSIPNRQNYQYSSNIYGTNVIVFNGTNNTVLLYAIYSSQKQQLEVVANDSDYTTILEYNHNKQITNVQQQNFVLPSSYTPSGYRIEVCKGNINISISNKTIPSWDQQQVTYYSENFQNLKGYFNLSNVPANMFMTINQVQNDSSYIVYSSYSDTRPQPTSKTIQVIQSDKNGQITLQIDKAVSSSNITYSAYIVDMNQNVNFNNSCGIKYGQKVSDDIKLQSSDQSIQIQLNQLLTDTHMMLNVIAHDELMNIDNSYEAIEVYKGMPLIMNNYDQNSNTDLTWIIYVVLAIVIVAAVCLTYYFLHKKNQYTRLIQADQNDNKLQNPI